MLNILKDTAPSYWAKNLPLIPLHPREKRPIPLDWSRFKESMPTPHEQDYWITNYPNSNVGLPLGPQSGCVAIDIDTEDTTLAQIIENLCGYSPWHRIGAKGKVMMFQFTGIKNFKIKDHEGKMICECLGAGNQVVLPPSIHPSTGQPYYANSNLLEVYNTLKPLPQDIETILRSAICDYGVQLSHSGWTRTTEYVSQGSRDVKMTSMAGFFANGVTRGELPLLEAIDRMRAWKSSCVENVAGDDVDIEKGISKLVQFVVQDVVGPKNRPLPLGWDAGLTADQKKQWGLNFDIDHQEWNVEQLKNYLLTGIESAGTDTLKRAACIEYVLQRLAKSPSLSSLEVDMLIKYIVQTNKADVNQSAIRNRLAELTRGEIAGLDHTEIAEAVIKDMERVGPLIFWNDRVWQYTGSNWEKISNNTFFKIIAENYGHLNAGKRSTDHKGILQVLQTLIPQGSPDRRNIKGVNFANGFVDIEGKIYPHTPEFGATYTLPFRFCPELAEQKPMFDKFLRSVWGHTEDFESRVKAIRQAMGITFFGLGPSFARAILLYGVAQSGKTQLLDIVQNLLPKDVITYVIPYDFDKGFSVVELSHSLMNVCGELTEDKPIPGAMFKQVIDGSKLQAAYKFGQEFSFSPQATHWFASNHLPRTRDVSEGFNRRWAVFSFDQPVKKEDKVRDIGSLIVAEEREAIAAWVILGAAELESKSDLDLPPSHYDNMVEIASENDSVFFFLASPEGPKLDMVGGKTSNGLPEKNTVFTIKINSLYERYQNFCYGTVRARPVGLRKFIQRLKDLGAARSPFHLRLDLEDVHFL